MAQNPHPDAYHSGDFEAISAHTGDVLWRTPEEGGFVGQPRVIDGMLLQDFSFSGAWSGISIHFYNLFSGRPLDLRTASAMPLARLGKKFFAVDSVFRSLDSYQPVLMTTFTLQPPQKGEELTFAPDPQINSPYANGGAEDTWASNNDFYAAINGRVYRYDLALSPEHQRPALIVGPDTPFLGTRVVRRTSQWLNGSIIQTGEGTIEGPVDGQFVISSHQGLWLLRSSGRLAARATKFSDRTALATQTIMLANRRIVVGREDGSVSVYDWDGRLLEEALISSRGRIDRLVVAGGVGLACCDVEAGTARTMLLIAFQIP